jgi:DNA-binding NtrC family response regulator
VEIHLPPLRERLSDLEQLCEHFVSRFANEFALPVPKLEESFYERLRDYHFPGNIRELMNIIERIFILSPKPSWDRRQLDGLVEESPINKPKLGNIQDNMSQTEYQMILHALQEANWIQKDAAKLLGMTESTFSRHKNRLGIKR